MKILGAQKWPKEGQEGGLLCGEEGCRMEVYETSVAVLRDLKSFNEECAWADILIASDPLPDCDGALTIDRFTTKRGGYALSFKRDGSFDIETSVETRGQRPWAPH